MSDGRVLFCRGEEEEADHDEVWDDAELIAAYDRAMDLTRAELGITGSTADDKAAIKKWRIGDFCRAVYSEDGLPYEAEILTIGGARCRLRYVGYGNEEDLPLGRLLKSEGKKARKKQERAAEDERLAVEEAGEEDYEEGDGEEVDNDEEEQGEGEQEEASPEIEKSKQRVPKKGRNPASRITSHPASGRQLWQEGGYPWQSHPDWGPWSAGQYGPMTGPRGPHFEPWRSKPGPWGATPPFPSPWGPAPGHHGFSQTQSDFFPGQSDANPSFHPPPPPPPPMAGDGDPLHLANMLMAWYISGYHTGYYQARREAGARRMDGK